MAKYYREEVAGALKEEFAYENVMQIPKVEKVVVNMGLGEAIQNPKAIEFAVEDITRITGQKPVVTKAKKSIATFKLREGMPIGVMVTLRRQRMWEFMERLINVALPRVRDFQGVSRSLMGRKLFVGHQRTNHLSESDYDKVDKIRDSIFLLSPQLTMRKKGFARNWACLSVLKGFHHDVRSYFRFFDAIRNGLHAGHKQSLALLRA